ncbi:pyrroline-5-carboxylate reductase family protein [Sphingomonas sp. RS2018]
MSDARAIWLVGAGNMGGAMLSRWIAHGIDPARITVIDPGAPMVPAGVAVVASVPEGPADVVVLAVKPQQLDQVAPALAAARPRVLLSILAGAEAATLAARVPGAAVVRAMPNLPVSIGQGVVALYGDVDAETRAVADTLMAPLGLVEWIDDEALFHAVIAVSGSGPAFVFRFIDALAQGAADMGMDPMQARRLAIATLGGAAALAAASDVSPAVLADRVASKGGTTRAGLDVLDAGDALLRLIAATQDATAKRSAEMAEEAR